MVGTRLSETARTPEEIRSEGLDVVEEDIHGAFGFYNGSSEAWRAAAAIVEAINMGVADVCERLDVLIAMVPEENADGE